MCNMQVCLEDSTELLFHCATVRWPTVQPCSQVPASVRASPRCASRGHPCPDAPAPGGGSGPCLRSVPSTELFSEWTAAPRPVFETRRLWRGGRRQGILSRQAHSSTQASLPVRGPGLAWPLSRRILCMARRGDRRNGEGPGSHGSEPGVRFVAYRMSGTRWL